MSYQIFHDYDVSTNDEKLRFISSSKRMSWKVMAASSAAMTLRKWLSGSPQLIIIGSLAISGCNSNDSGEYFWENWARKDKQTQQDNGNAATKPLHKEVGEASWYGPGFQGQETANGEIFNQKEMTAAHPTLPMGTKAKVTNLENGKKIEVRINDRGPFIGNRAIDLSSAAANKLDMKEDGNTQVKIETKPAKKKRSAGHSRKKKSGVKRLKSN